MPPLYLGKKETTWEHYILISTNMSCWSPDAIGAKHLGLLVFILFPSTRHSRAGGNPTLLLPQPHLLPVLFANLRRLGECHVSLR